MKSKIIILLSAPLLAYGLASCARTEMEAADEAESATVTFKAVRADAAATKTYLKDSLYVYWDNSEDINLFYGASFAGKFSSSDVDESGAAEFTGTLDGIRYSDGDRFLAVYPYSETNACDGESVTLTLPASQTAVAKSFADGLFIMLAEAGASERILAFYNLCGGISFSVSQPGISSVTFRGNGGEPLAGTAKASFGEDGTPVADVTGAEAELTLTAPGGMFATNTWYYLVAFPVELPEGYTLTLHKTDGSDLVKQSSRSVAIRRSVWGRLANADLAASELDPEGDFIRNPYGIYNLPGKEDVVYQKETQQLHLLYDDEGGRVYFRILDPAAVRFTEVGPIPLNAGKGDTFSVGVSTFEEGSLSEERFDVTLEQASGDRLLLKSGDTSFIVSK